MGPESQHFPYERDDGVVAIRRGIRNEDTNQYLLEGGIGTGSILYTPHCEETWILTAAHCLVSEGKHTKQPSSLMVCAISIVAPIMGILPGGGYLAQKIFNAWHGIGYHNPENLHEYSADQVVVQTHFCPRVTSYAAKEVYVHPDYWTTKRIDLALIKLDSKVPTAYPFSLPSNLDLDPATPLDIYGYGITGSFNLNTGWNTHSTQEKRRGKVFVASSYNLSVTEFGIQDSGNYLYSYHVPENCLIDSNERNAILKRVYGGLPPSPTFLAGGDSGGPLALLEAAEDSKVIYGVTSTGSLQGICLRERGVDAWFIPRFLILAPYFPKAQYTPVFPHLKWMKDTIGASSEQE